MFLPGFVIGFAEIEPQNRSVLKEPVGIFVFQAVSLAALGLPFAKHVIARPGLYERQ